MDSRRHFLRRLVGLAAGFFTAKHLPTGPVGQTLPPISSATTFTIQDARWTTSHWAMVLDDEIIATGRFDND